MARARILAVILAGGAGGRLGPLTEARAKPAMPFGGVYRLIDFPLSNCRNAGLGDVWVIEQFNPSSLSDHLANGRPWDLDRNLGGLLVLHPHLGSGEEGWHRGTADALWRQRHLIRQFFSTHGPGPRLPAPDALMVLSADAVYRLDYGAVVDEHLANDADATLVTTRVDPADAGRYGVVAVTDGHVTDYRYKPDDPQGDLVSNEVFVFRPDRTLDMLEELAADADPDEGLRDVGNDLLPRLVAEGAVREYRLDGYWRDVGTIDSYWSAHMDLIDGRFELDDLARPILTYGVPRPPARVDGGSIDAGLVSPGCIVRGRVERSVLSTGVVVERGAVVRQSVLLPGVVVKSGATVEKAVVDDDAVIGEGARVGGTKDDVAVVARGEQVG